MTEHSIFYCSHYLLSITMHWRMNGFYFNRRKSSIGYTPTKGRMQSPTNDTTHRASLSFFRESSRCSFMYRKSNAAKPCLGKISSLSTSLRTGSSTPFTELPAENVTLKLQEKKREATAVTRGMKWAKENLTIAS
jgi:hypothetical protein